jgi:hypothetical protein
MIKQYELKARTEERRFIRYLQKQGYFHTVQGRINYFVNVSQEYLVIKTSVGRSYIQISRKQLRKSIHFVWFNRTAIRNDLQRFTKYTSALLGILFEVFNEQALVKRLKNGLLRLSLNSLRFFASGAERDPAIRNLIKAAGGNFLLFNYFHIRHQKNWSRILEDDDYYCLIDSGAFSVYNQKRKNRTEANVQLSLFHENEIPMISREEYSTFINKYKSHTRILGFFNLDIIEDGKESMQNFEYLYNTCPGAKIYPVWQFSSSIDSLEDLVNDRRNFEVIGIGGLVPYLSNRQQLVRKKLTEVFRLYPQANFHFLGGANRMLREFPFFSSDSSAYLNSRKSANQRKVYLENGHRVKAPEHMSTNKIIFQNLKYLFNLENRETFKQLTLTELSCN